MCPELPVAAEACGVHTRFYFESVSRLCARLQELLPCGKLLLIADEESAEGAALLRGLFAPFTLLFVLYGKGEGETGLFSLPDDVRAAVAVGRRSIAAARFFCTLRRAYCIAVPDEWGARGALEEKCGNGYPVSAPDILLFDASFARRARAENVAFAALADAMAEDTEIDAVFSGERKEGYAPLRPAAKYAAGGAEEVFAATALRILVERSSPACPAAAFSRLAEKEAGEGAGTMAALGYTAQRYAAFFGGASPREYYVADYAARARAAEPFGGAAVYKNMRVPDLAENAAHIRVFGECRAHFALSASLLKSRAQSAAEQYYLAGGKVPALSRETLAKLYSLSAELSPLLSVSALERDFGTLPHMCGGAYAAKTAGKMT